LKLKDKFQKKADFQGEKYAYPAIVDQRKGKFLLRLSFGKFGPAALNGWRNPLGNRIKTPNPRRPDRLGESPE